MVLPGSVRTDPSPVVARSPASLAASFTDVPTGGGLIQAAEYSLGSAPAAAGAGTPMELSGDSSVAQASADLPTENLSAGPLSIWVRAKDSAGDWGPGARFVAGINDSSALGRALPRDYLATAAPNPFRTSTAIRFGAAHAGRVQFELYDVSGRRVRTLVNADLAVGEKAALWDGLDDRGAATPGGVFFVRLVTPTGELTSRLVGLR